MWTQRFCMYQRWQVRIQLKWPWIWDHVGHPSTPPLLNTMARCKCVMVSIRIVNNQLTLVSNTEVFFASPEWHHSTFLGIKRGFVTLYKRITYIEYIVYERSTWIECILDVLWRITINTTHGCFALMWLRDHWPYIARGFSHITIHIIMSSIWKVGSVKRPFISKPNRDIKNSNRLTRPTY